MSISVILDFKQGLYQPNVPQALFNLISQSALCNRMRSLEQRCCRWLLLTQDWASNDEFALTHEFLSQMLEVRRAGVHIDIDMFENAPTTVTNYFSLTIIGDIEALSRYAPT